MTLILLAISLSIALCVIAYNFAIYALPVMVGITAFQYVYGTGAGFLMSGLNATCGTLRLSAWSSPSLALRRTRHFVLSRSPSSPRLPPSPDMHSFTASRKTPSTRPLR